MRSGAYFEKAHFYKNLEEHEQGYKIPWKFKNRLVNQMIFEGKTSELLKVPALIDRGVLSDLEDRVGEDELKTIELMKNTLKEKSR